ncbi:hypothetical protein Thein_0409 [Thermodesulfatator indicus DSM 15286]|uniref:Uncharacterized protein n=1 Tax=Thermodesulfatator indicus (strain DSM 15286 / JCM 11887 / CIR29812) TaxID=667014 RepID=F8AAL9_THEID|nr:hypothetical protein [Thermodesulfatator indicus]AEH44291.1 hypothetical protein Thein_0409 [Thermodesulfatator indicus DSM 15286]
MSLPNDKDFELAVDKAIDEIFGKVESQTLEPSEDDEVKVQLELEPLLETESNLNDTENKVINFPQLEETLRIVPNEEKEEEAEEKLTQQDLEKIAASLLSLEWEVTPETSFEFLATLEEIKQKADQELHPIFDLLHEVGNWLKERPEEARPEWLHFLHQGIVALNLIVIHGKDIDPYLRQLQTALKKLKKGPETKEDKIKGQLIKQLVYDYQRFLMFEWLFGRSPKTRHWLGICQKSLKEIEDTLKLLPPEEQPDLEKIKEKIFEKTKILAKKSTQSKIINKKEIKEKIHYQKRLNFKEGYHCFTDNEEFIVPASQVAYFGPFKPNWEKKISENFPLILLLGIWRFFSFIKLKNKFKGELSQKSEQELKNMSLPIIKRSDDPEFIMILWEDNRGGILLLKEAVFVEIPEKAFSVSKGNKKIVFIEDKELPIIQV